MALVNGPYVSPNDGVVEQTMGKGNEKRDIKKIGIDLAKGSFQAYAANALGKQVMNRKMAKQELKAFMPNLVKWVWKLAVAPTTGHACPWGLGTRWNWLRRNLPSRL
jgi:hypothetical protein